MSFDLPTTDMVYVTGLPAGVTEDDIAGYFGSIGVIKLDKKTKKPKIWLYRDKETGALKGDGTVSYDDPFSAASAVDWFSNKEWKGARARTRSAQSAGTASGTRAVAGPFGVCACVRSRRLRAHRQPRRHGQEGRRRLRVRGCRAQGEQQGGPGAACSRPS